MNPLPRPLALMFVSLLLLGVCSTAGAHGNGELNGGRTGARHRGIWQSLTKRQVIEAAGPEFEQARKQLEGNPALSHELNALIDRTSLFFSKKAVRNLPSDNDYRYSKWEVDHMSNVTSAVIKLARDIAINDADTTISADKKKLNREAMIEQGTRKVMSLQMELVHVARTSSPPPIDAGWKDKGKDAAEDAPHEGGMGGKVGSTVGKNEASRDDADFLEKFIKRSPVASLTNSATLWALSKEKDIPADPETPHGGGSATTGGSTGSGGSSSGSGATIEDVIQSIAGPGGAQLLANHASNAYQQGNFSEAYQDAQQVLKVDPSNQLAMAVSQFSAGRAGAMEGGPAGAAAAAAAAGGGNERSLMGGGERGASYGNSPRAALLSGSPAASSAARFARDGENALRLGDLAGAKAYADKGLAASPDDAYLRALRAKIFMSQREYGKSLDDINAALARDPSNLTLLRAKAFAQNRAKKWRDAASTAGQILELDPNDAYGYAYRAHAMAGMGERDAMMSDIARAARLDPRFAEAARQAGALQLPSNGDIMFLFPGESGPSAAQAPAPEGRSKRFGALVAVSALGGLLLAFGLLQTVLAPLKEQVSSVFTKITRTGPSTRSFTPPLAASSASGLLPGLIRGQYEVSRQIGAGGMGMVYEGTDRSLGRRVAIKKMRDEIRADARERARFVTEAKTVAALHHPSIVDIYAIAEDGDDVFLVFEYVDGKTVHELVQTKGGLDPHAAGRIVSDVAAALSFAHSRGVIHRDMKPSNIMVDGHGRVKVMDFGIARAAKDAMTRYSVTNTVVGTPPYMAPEQEQGQVRRESDVYALGVCAYEMLTGKLPFAGTGGGMMLNKINMSYVPPSRQKEGLPAALDAVFERVFQADPDKRFRTPAEFSSAFSSALPGLQAPSCI